MSGKSRKGFTLAEVLITLSIIGVVAALTIPTLAKKHEKQQWIAGYKATFSIINQATMMIAANNGGTIVGAWEGGLNSPYNIYNAYKPYLKINKVCEFNTNCFASSYQELDKTGNYNFASGGISVVLSNGASVFFRPSVVNNDDFCNEIHIDTNGKKGPNQWGKDFHFICIRGSGKPSQVSPLYNIVNKDSYEGWVKSGCPDDLSKDGINCGIRILRGDYGTAY